MKYYDNVDFLVGQLSELQLGGNSGNLLQLYKPLLIENRGILKWEL